MENLPEDPFMLVSVLNMKLRDAYSSLDDLCNDLGIDRHTIEDKLRKAGFSYIEESNSFR